MSLEYRYLKDPSFRALVNLLEDTLACDDFTPSEIADAAALARIRRNTTIPEAPTSPLYPY